MSLNSAGNADEWTSTLYASYPGAPAEVPETEDWAFDRHITRGGAFRHDRDLARCARRHGAYEANCRPSVSASDWRLRRGEAVPAGTRSYSLAPAVRPPRR